MRCWYCSADSSGSPPVREPGRRHRLHSQQLSTLHGTPTAAAADQKKMFDNILSVIEPTVAAVSAIQIVLISLWSARQTSSGKRPAHAPERHSPQGPQADALLVGGLQARRRRARRRAAQGVTATVEQLSFATLANGGIGGPVIGDPRMSRIGCRKLHNALPSIQADVRIKGVIGDAHHRPGLGELWSQRRGGRFIYPAARSDNHAVPSRVLRERLPRRRGEDDVTDPSGSRRH